MANSTQNARISEPEGKPVPKASLALHWKVLISVVLLVHMTALIAAPMAAGPCSELERQVARSFSWYTTLAYIDHGYRFFCPEPSAGHLVRYTLSYPNGTTKTDVFPNLKEQWPRLLYHRFFMLSEKLARLMSPDIPADAPEEVRRDAEVERKVMQPALDAMVRSYGMHLLETTGAKAVTLEYVEHEIPEEEDMLRDRPLTDPGLYKVLWTKTYEAPKL
ncbi:MAG TPA: hypothetical protein VMJ32_10620 [Pirellulales bacterium]|nr:hypothetical protein [Pirellulales bacterium]